MNLWWGFRGIPPAQMNSMVPGTHMGRLLCPKPSLFHYFVGISSFPGKLQVAPASLAYFPLWGPAAVAEGLRIILCLMAPFRDLRAGLGVSLGNLSVENLWE